MHELAGTYVEQEGIGRNTWNVQELTGTCIKHWGISRNMHEAIPVRFIHDPVHSILFHVNSCWFLKISYMFLFIPAYSRHEHIITYEYIILLWSYSQLTCDVWLQYCCSIVNAYFFFVFFFWHSDSFLKNEKKNHD